MKAMIKGEDLPHLHQAPPRHPKWMKIKKKMIHNLKKVFQRQHPMSKNMKSKMFHHKHKSSMIHLNKHPRKMFKMDECKPIKTPMATNGHLDLDVDGKPVDQSLYHSMIESLLYLTHIGPI